MQLAQGTLLERGKYRILETLGRGGFGVTYLAEQVMAKRKVCIKEFFPKDYYKRDGDSWCLTLSSDGFAEMMGKFKVKFVKEAQTIAALDHPNIIPIHDVFEENGTAYYVMDYVDGESLSDKVKRSGALSEADAVAYIRQVAEALDYIHEQQIMHLDVKPGNVMVRSKDNRALLIDFGLSKHYDTNSGEATSTTPVGVSHGYAPIEQYQQGGISQFSPETDIYSLGATLYYLITGKTPPQAAILITDPLEPPQNISSSIRAAITQAMSISPKQRPHSCEEFMSLLGNATPKAEPKQRVSDDERTIIEGHTKDYHNTRELYNQGIAYYNQKNYTEAVKFFRQAAEQGHASAQNKLGYCYRKGYGVPKDDSKAVEWYRKAAEQGNAYAQYNLGFCYYNGNGVTKDYTKAVEWYRKAAEQGHASAQNYLGLCYEDGYGVTKDYSKAVEWYRKAAEQGNAVAQSNLGVCYRKGYGVPQDYNKAVEWYRKAAEQGYASAQHNLGYCYEKGYGVPQDYNKAVEWYRKAAEQGHARAQNNLGLCYEKGYGVTQDYSKAVEWYRKAAEQGHAIAQCNLGYCYENGYGVTKDYNKAVEWYRKAARQGNTTAQENLRRLGESW